MPQRSGYLSLHMLAVLSLLCVPGIAQDVPVSLLHDQAVCEALRSSPRVTSANLRAAGPLPNAPIPSHGPAISLPRHCDVRVRTSTGPDSVVNSEIWLPLSSAWNGKLLATGNGGYSSALSVPLMADGLAQGYAVAGSDTGHTGDALSFGVGRPESIRDWAYRATHVLATEAKIVIAKFYEKPAAHSYFSGCSTGGQQALSEAQRYPEDFDGIIAGDPGNDRIRLNADFVASWLITHPENASQFPAAKLALLNKAVVAACDLNDGVQDGVISDPPSCRFDPAMVACHAGTLDVTGCLSEQEVAMVRRLYEGPVRDASDRPIFPGWARGSETGWSAYLVSPAQPVRLEFWTDWVYGKGSSKASSFNMRKFDAPESIAAARANLPYTEAIDPDLHAFAKRGGKLLLYHGWSDPVVPPEDTIDYYSRVSARLGTSPNESALLFMVPGMGHCGGGPGAFAFDPVADLDRWVTTKQAPGTILAKHMDAGHESFSRPLCPYPQMIRYDGHSDTTQASSFTCATSTP